MLGTIQTVRRSKSNKNLSVQVDGRWFTSKNWEWETDPHIVGKRIIFESAEQKFPDGGSIDWINDYVFEEASNTPSGQAMERAMADQQPTPPAAAYEASQAPVTVQKDRDASIVAQALTKACTGPGEPVTDVWTKYITLYQSYMAWKP